MTKQKKILIGLACAFVLLLALYLAVIRPLGGRDQKNETPEEVTLLPGESYYFGKGFVKTVALLYPQFSRTDTAILTVKNKNGTYSFTHYISDASSEAKNYFLLGVDSDGDGEQEYYQPPISTRFRSFDYSSLYDAQTKLPSAMIAAGLGYFKERVYVRAEDGTNPSDEQYQKILARYGLSEADSPAYFEILGYALDEDRNIVYETEDKIAVYRKKGADGKMSYFYADGSAYTGEPAALLPRVDGERYQRVYVGDRTPDKTGYYVYVAGRDVIYATSGSTVGDLVFRDLGYYVYPRLITATSEAGAPYMPVSFRIWTKSVEQQSLTVGEKSVVGYYTPNVSENGVDLGESRGFFHLIDETLDPRIRDVLLGASVGDRVTVTQIQPDLLLSPLAEGNTVTYEVLRIFAVIRGDRLLDAAGTTVGAGDVALVEYRLRSEDSVGTVLTGAIDTARIGVSPALVSAIVGKSVGKGGAEPIASVPVLLDEEYGDKITYRYHINAIGGYATREDLSDIVTKEGTKLGTKGYAVVEYTVELDGKIYTETAKINLEGESTELGKQLRAAILSPVTNEDGKSEARAVGAQSGLSVAIAYAYSPISSYIVYEDLEIRSASSYREELSFGFVNEPQRDPFYGSSIYEITGPIDRTMYSISAAMSQTVLQAFSDLQGLETVHVGLTSEAIEKYGLSAHVFYFEMPFGVDSYSEIDEYGDETVIYTHRYSIGYYLYVSERQEDGTYYVASTEYDLVAKASGDTFEFIDWSFGSDWVDKKLLQTDITDLFELGFDINFSDLKETHTFSLSTNRSYLLYQGIDAEGNDSYAKQDRIYVWYAQAKSIPYKVYTVTADKVVLDNTLYNDPSSAGKLYIKAGRMIVKNGSHYVVRDVDTEGAESGKSVNLDSLYPYPDEPPMLDYDGAKNFKNLLQLIYLSYYSGESANDLDAEEISALLSDPARRLLTIRLRLASETAITGGDEYELSFYRYSDVRCLVRFENKRTGAVSTEFYLHYAEVKNIVTAVRTLVAGKEVSASESWLPEPSLPSGS